MYEQRIQFRRDTAIRWAHVNPVLLDGEPGYELDTGFWKVGDGVKSWNELGYKAEDGLQGPPGIQGLQGIQGVKGDKGERGDTGGVGLTGPSNTISIGTVTAGESAGDAAAYLTGTSPSQVLNLVLPKGNKGDQGEKGNTGIQGIQGINGPQGLRGEKGEKGDQGIQGIGGPNGDAAGINVRGVASVWPPSASPAAEDLWILSTPLPPGTPAGFSAGDGALWTGIVWQNVGPIRGPVGPQGIQGVKGDRGDTGIQGLQGAQGVQGAQGLKGDKGDKGATGSHGIQGPAGPANVLSIGTVASSPPGSQPAVAIIGSSPAQVLSFTFPQPFTNSLSIGTVVEGPAASATITGSAPNQVLNLVLPNPQVAHVTGFSVNPQNATVEVGETVEFTAEAQSTGTNLLYKWQRFGLDWADITGAFGKTYSFTPTLSDNSGQFRCFASTQEGSTAASLTAVLSVIAKAPNDGSVWRDGNGQASTGHISFANNRFFTGSKYSLDGINWLATSLDLAGTVPVLYGNGFYWDGVTKSTDGVNFANAYPENYIKCLAFDGTRYLGSWGSGSTSYFHSTTDAVNYSSIAPTGLGSQGLRFLTFSYGSSRFFGTTYGTSPRMAIVSSADGVAWTESAMKDIGVHTAKSLCFYNASAPQKHMIFVPGNKYYTSTDGAAWTARDLPTSASWSGVAFGNGTYILTQSEVSTTCLTSTDGVNWQVRNTMPSAAYDSLAYGSGKFVAHRTNAPHTAHTG